jgi:hypothetical protein
MGIENTRLLEIDKRLQTTLESIGKSASSTQTLAGTLADSLEATLSPLIEVVDDLMTRVRFLEQSVADEG